MTRLSSISLSVTASYITRVVRLAFLSPDIVEAILAGKTPAMLNAESLRLGGAIAPDWNVQRDEMLGS